MQYRDVPKTGEKLSILGFGCMRLPLQDGRIDEDRAAEQIRLAIDQGVNYLDTAWPYHSGESEHFLGRTLAGGYRDKVHLATKLPSWMIRSRRDMDFYLDAQLQKLKTAQIDYYLLHTLNGYHWANLHRLGVLDFLDQAKADGRIRNAGFSFHGLFRDFQEIVDAYAWDVCQIQYNYLDNAVALCISRDLPFAHARFCETEGLKDVIPLSEMRHREFGASYGLHLQEGPLAGLLARAVFILDENGIIVYHQLVDEITDEPDYEQALAALRTKAGEEVCTTSRTAEHARPQDADEPCDDGRAG